MTSYIYILADQWFIVEEDVALHGARLKSLLFTRGKQQLSQRVSCQLFDSMF